MGTIGATISEVAGLGAGSAAGGPFRVVARRVGTLRVGALRVGAWDAEVFGARAEAGEAFAEDVSVLRFAI